MIQQNEKNYLQIMWLGSRVTALEKVAFYTETLLRDVQKLRWLFCAHYRIVVDIVALCNSTATVSVSMHLRFFSSFITFLIIGLIKLEIC